MITNSNNLPTINNFVSEFDSEKEKKSIKDFTGFRPNIHDADALFKILINASHKSYIIWPQQNGSYCLSINLNNKCIKHVQLVTDPEFKIIYDKKNGYTDAKEWLHEFCKNNLLSEDDQISKTNLVSEQRFTCEIIPTNQNERKRKKPEIDSIHLDNNTINMMVTELNHDMENLSHDIEYSKYFRRDITDATASKKMESAEPMSFVIWKDLTSDPYKFIYSVKLKNNRIAYDLFEITVTDPKKVVNSDSPFSFAAIEYKNQHFYNIQDFVSYLGLKFFS